MGKPKEGNSLPKLVGAYVRKAEESALGRLIVELVVLQSTQSKTDAAKILREAATLYKVDTDAITTEVRREFAARERGKKAIKPPAKTQSRATTKTAA
jgi:ParB family chromosome partitioning protein